MKKILLLTILCLIAVKCKCHADYYYDEYIIPVIKTTTIIPAPHEDPCYVRLNLDAKQYIYVRRPNIPEKREEYGGTYSTDRYGKIIKGTDTRGTKTVIRPLLLDSNRKILTDKVKLAKLKVLVEKERAEKLEQKKMLEERKQEIEKEREISSQFDMVSGSREQAEYQQQQYDKFQEEQEIKRRKNDPIGCYMEDLKDKAKKYINGIGGN